MEDGQPTVVVPPRTVVISYGIKMPHGTQRTWWRYAAHVVAVRSARGGVVPSVGHRKYGTTALRRKLRYSSPNVARYHRWWASARGKRLDIV